MIYPLISYGSVNHLPMYIDFKSINDLYESLDFNPIVMNCFINSNIVKSEIYDIFI